MNILKNDKNQSTKEKILIATINASVKKIRNPYSLCNIAKDVGISKPAIFKYFCCKDSLIKAATSKAFDDIAAIYIQIKNQYDSDTAKIIQYFSLWLLKNPSHLSFIFNQFMMEKDFSNIVVTELCSRGVELKKDFLSPEGIKEVYVIFSVVTLMSCLLNHYKNESAEISEKQYEDFALGISNCICYGVKKQSDNIEIDYNSLDEIYKQRKQEFYEHLKNTESEQDTNQNKNEERFFYALTEVVKKHSFSGVTIEQLAEEAGLAKSSLYTWFKNKDDLLKKVILGKFLQLKDLIEHNIKSFENVVEKSYVILKTETDWLLENISVLPVATWLNFSGNGTTNVGEILISNSNWVSKLFSVEALGLVDSDLPAIWLTCLPVPMVLEGNCKGYTHQFLLNSVKQIHSMLWNGILNINEEN